MKSSSLSKIALLTCALGAASFTFASADDTTTTTPPASGSTCQAGGTCHKGWHHHFDSVLTADEKAELKKDREQVFAANPDLKAEGKALWESSKGLKDATPDEKKAQFEKWHAYAAKVDAAIVAVDANAAPIIAKLKAAHHHHHHHSDSDTSSDSSSS